MSGFILECLFSTGWRRTGELYWRLSDAKHEANKRVKGGKARASRVLPVTIQPDPAYVIDSDPVAI